MRRLVVLALKPLRMEAFSTDIPGDASRSLSCKHRCSRTASLALRGCTCTRSAHGLALCKRKRCQNRVKPVKRNPLSEVAIRA